MSTGTRKRKIMKDESHACDLEIKRKGMLLLTSLITSYFSTGTHPCTRRYNGSVSMITSTSVLYCIKILCSRGRMIPWTCSIMCHINLRNIRNIQNDSDVSVPHLRFACKKFTYSDIILIVCAIRLLIGRAASPEQYCVFLIAEA